MKQDVNDQLEKAGSKLYFDRVAENWDSMRQIFFSDSLREKAIKTSGIQKGQIAADIGAGTGFISEGLLEAGVSVIAVDQSENMLEEMKTKFSGTPHIEYRIGDGEQLPIPTASVDHVFANMYLHHSEHPFLAIKEMVRILKPGGMVVITDLDQHTYEFLKTEHHDRWLGFWRDDVRHWMHASGLSGIVVDGVDEECSSESGCGCVSARIGIFMAAGKRRD